MLADLAVRTPCLFMRLDSLPEIVVVGIRQDGAVLDSGREGRAVERPRRSFRPFDDDGRRFHRAIIARNPRRFDHPAKIAIARARVAADGLVPLDELLEPGPERIQAGQDLAGAGTVFLTLDPELAVGKPVTRAGLTASAGGDEQEEESSTRFDRGPDSVGRSQDQFACTVIVTVALSLPGFGSVCPEITCATPTMVASTVIVVVADSVPTRALIVAAP